MSEKIDKRAWQAALVAVAVLALCYGAFEFGRTSAGYFIVSAMLERFDLAKRNDALVDENDKLRHRVAVRPEAELDGVTADGVLDTVLASVPAPR